MKSDLAPEMELQCNRIARRFTRFMVELFKRSSNPAPIVKIMGDGSVKIEKGKKEPDFAIDPRSNYGPGYVGGPYSVSASTERDALSFAYQYDTRHLLPWQCQNHHGHVVASFHNKEDGLRFLYTIPFLINGIDAVPPQFRYLFDPR